MIGGVVPVLAVAHGFGEGVEKLGVVVAALLAGVVVLARPPRVSERLRALAMLAAIVLTPALLLADVWSTSQVTHLRHHPAEAALAIVLGLLLVAALTGWFARRPTDVALAAIACLPFRLPISTGGTTSNLLIPLYVVVGAGVLAYALPLLRGEADEFGEPPPGRMEWLLLAAVCLYALQDAYSADFSKGLENVVFFYVPFALLFGLLLRLPWTRSLLLLGLAIAVGEAVLFSGVGFIEYATKHLLLNPKVVQANNYDNYFRVNSIFFDPSIYGRFLALVMVFVTTIVLWTRQRREVVLGAVVLAWLLAGIVTSFSQSSIAALLLGLAVLAAYRWNLRDTVLVCVAVAALAAIVVLLAPSHAHLGLSGGAHSANNATSGRYSLISNGLKLFAHRPLQGYGAGSFSHVYLDHYLSASGDSATSASHTIPITVAAEQGIVGLILYAALLVAAFGRLFRGADRSLPRIAIAAAFAALVLHTMVYADFLEDPVTWTLLAIGAALAAGVAPDLARGAAREPVAASPPTGGDGETSLAASGAA